MPASRTALAAPNFAKAATMVSVVMRNPRSCVFRWYLRSAAHGRRGLAVSNAIDRAGIIVGDQQRAVPHHLHVHRAAEIVVVLEKSGHERLLRPHAAVPVQI